jgi:hypothetical protein
MLLVDPSLEIGSQKAYVASDAHAGQPARSDRLVDPRRPDGEERRGFGWPEQRLGERSVGWSRTEGHLLVHGRTSGGCIQLSPLKSRELRLPHLRVGCEDGLTPASKALPEGSASLCPVVALVLRRGAALPSATVCLGCCCDCCR